MIPIGLIIEAAASPSLPYKVRRDINVFNMAPVCMYMYKMYVCTLYIHYIHRVHVCALYIHTVQFNDSDLDLRLGWNFEK